MTPIRPEMRDRYPPDWKQISDRIKFERAKGRCECVGECGRDPYHLDPIDGRCVNRHGQPAIGSGSKVVLTTAHLNHEPSDCRDEALKAMCQGCHLWYDREHHAETKRDRRLREAADGDGALFALDTDTPA